MPFHISNEEIRVHLKNLRDKAKAKYVNLGEKLLVSSVNTLNLFAHHLIVLQGKNPDKHLTLESLFGPRVDKVIKNVRPSFRFGSTKGWTKSHFTNPEEYHPILLNRTKSDEKDILEASKEAANILATLEAGLNASLPKEEEKGVKVVSGARRSVKKTVAKKKTTKKKVVRVKKGRLS